MNRDYTIICISLILGALYLVKHYYDLHVAPYKLVEGTWALIEEHKYGPNIGCDIRLKFNKDGTSTSIGNELVSHSTYTLKPLEVGYRYTSTGKSNNGGRNCSGNTIAVKYSGFTNVGFLQLNSDGDSFLYCGDQITKDGYKKSSVCTIYERIENIAKFEIKNNES